MLAQVLKDQGEIGVAVIKAAIDVYSATGKSGQSVRYESTHNTLQIFARGFIEALETGVSPTDKGVHPDMIKSLTEYAQARGMDKPKSAAWAMAKVIQAKGDKTYRSGGRTVYSAVMDKFVDQLMAAVAKDQLTLYQEAVSKSLKGIE